MSIDLTKLDPAPWRAGPISEPPYDDAWEVRDANGDIVGTENDIPKHIAEFMALARNAFDVVMRRHWFPALACRWT